MIVLLRVVLLISPLVLPAFSIMTSAGSDSTSSSLQVEKAVDFLVNSQFNESLSLCREAPTVAPNTYWLVSDNLWAWKALKVANETYYYGAGDVGRVADEIGTKLREEGQLYNLPRDLNKTGFPKSFMHEAVVGDVIPTPNRNTTILTLHSDDYIVKIEICNGTTMPDWYEYADRLLYKALSCHWEGNDTAANLYFKNATDTWDGIGISDKATKADGLYAMCKLALLLYTSKVLGRKLPFECELVKRIWSLQRESDGGIITNYYANGTQKGDANTETTSIVIIALLTPPRARLGTFAFYYPWYGTPDVSGYWSHWPPDGTSKITDHPLLGFYDSNNETLIEEHIGMAKEAGIGCFIVSWWGINDFTDNASRHIRNVCERNHFKFAFYYENTTSVSQTENDIKYILDNYANSSAYYKIDGRPVIYVYRRARDALNPDSWNLYFNGVNQSVNSASCWTLSEDIRRPPRYGIFAIEPHEYGIGYIENKYPIPLSANETYTLHIGISNIRNDYDPWSDVGLNISISNETNTTTLYKQVVNFNQGWIDLPPFDVSSYAGSNVTMRAGSFDDRNNDTWNSEWAAVDYFYISNSSGKPVNPDPYFDNGWNATVNQLRGEGFNPYIIMDFQGYEGKIDDFVEYFKDCIDGIHLYYPVGFSQDLLQVLDIYNNASKLTHLENKTFIATVVPGFNNTATESAPQVVDRRDGTHYALYWLIAKACSPDGYAITSFNEWHEGTEIEPSREYGYQYIYLTRRETIPEFSSIIILPLFMIATLLTVIVYRRKDHKWRMKIK
jgi:hypothetical protein